MILEIVKFEQSFKANLVQFTSIFINWKSTLFSSANFAYPIRSTSAKLKLPFLLGQGLSIELSHFISKTEHPIDSDSAELERKIIYGFM